jgi:hypothetical protein
MKYQFTENQKLILFGQVEGMCPLCDNGLTQKKKGGIYKVFEIAHIYPENATPQEVELLKDEERLSDDVNDVNNALAVCPTCHTKFDKPRTVEEYRKWVGIKKQLINKSKAKNIYSLYTIESKIFVVLNKLQTVELGDNSGNLSLESLKIDEKADETLPPLTKRTIKHNVVDYFDYIKKLFIEIDKEQPFTFNLIATQVKAAYIKLKQINNDQEFIFWTLVDWLDKKTDNISKEACEIIISFFVQNCEVFSNDTSE